jgi:uncharacterized membrane protein YtjA (UPF0391 family)
VNVSKEIPPANPGVIADRLSHDAVALSYDASHTDIPPKGESPMLYYAVIFFIIAIVAAVLGFGGIAAGAATIAQILFWVFLAVALMTGIAYLVQRR